MGSNWRDPAEGQSSYWLSLVYPDSHRRKVHERPVLLVGKGAPDRFRQIEMTVACIPEEHYASSGQSEDHDFRNNTVSYAV